MTKIDSLKSSNTISCVNADKSLNKWERLSWFIVNYLNNHLLPNQSKLNIKQFIPSHVDKYWDMIDSGASPSRVLSDLYWLYLDWKMIKNELDSINVLDTGCGSGEYFLKLTSFSNNHLNQYCGIDIDKKSRWNDLEKEHNNVTFKSLNSNNIVNVIPTDSNFFVSQSAIEHFEEDLVYFQQLKDFIDTTKNDVIQIHLFPAASCLTQYIWHGIRQYTPRTIEKITKIFENTKSYSVLYQLGGERCNTLHTEFITKPVYLKGIDFRITKKEEYVSRLKDAISHDKQTKKPSFYALVIHSNYKRRIFEDMELL